MEKPKEKIEANIAEYYDAKLAEHGVTARGVDWNGEDSQLLRFRQLQKIIDVDGPFTLNDLGCGYGAFFEYLSHQFNNFSYCGIDVSENMIIAARERYFEDSRAEFAKSGQIERVADFCVASGIFSVRMDHSDEEWQFHLESTLDLMDKSSRLGFAFNCLTTYSDAEKMRENLFYSDPCLIFDLCKKRFSKSVALLHDYGLYEFTILVRKHQ